MFAGPYNANTSGQSFSSWRDWVPYYGVGTLLQLAELALKYPQWMLRLAFVSDTEGFSLYQRDPFAYDYKAWQWTQLYAGNSSSSSSSYAPSFPSAAASSFYSGYVAHLQQRLQSIEEQISLLLTERQQTEATQEEKEQHNEEQHELKEHEFRLMREEEQDDVLPKELWTEILAMLDIQSFAAATIVNKAWYLRSKAAQTSSPAFLLAKVTKRTQQLQALEEQRFVWLKMEEMPRGECRTHKDCGQPSCCLAERHKLLP
ncbi:hypothetical protein QOT17_003344 [Balamuthia mandrillaris]